MSSQADQEAKQAAQAKPAQAEAQTPTQPAKLGNPGLVYLIGALVAGCFGAVIGYSFLGESLALLGIPDPGPLTTIGLPFVRGAAIFIGCLGLGGFLMSAFGTPPDKQGYLTLDGFRAARTGTWGMIGFAVLSILLIPMYMSDISGSPLKEVLKPEYWGIALDQVSASKAWLWVAIFAGVAGGLSLLTRKWIWQPIFLALSVLSLIPLALEGHSAAGGNHDYGVNSLLWHIICVSLWVGGLLALLAHAKRRGPHLALLVQRYSTLALFCIIAVAISGFINALLRVHLDELFTTQYGLVIVAKMVMTLLLAWFGWEQRSRIIPKLREGEGESGKTTNAQRKPFIRFAALEIFIMAATIGIAVSLGRIPPPIEQIVDLTQQDVLLGYTLTEPPSIGRYFTMFRLDLIFGVGAILLQAGYMWAWLSIRKRGIEWPIQRLIWWTAGNVTLLFATSSGLGMYSMAMFGPHMLQHVILSMAVPVFWVLGGPMTLLLRALPAAGRNGVAGPREWLVVFINNPFSRFLTHPIVAGTQFVVGFYYLYLSPLFDAIAGEHAGHLFMMLHFIISGYIFYWVIIGVDAAPRNLSPFIKMLTLFAMVTFHAWFGIAMMQISEPLNAEFYNQLDFPFPVDLDHQQYLGGSITWALGEIPLLVVSIAHGFQWLRSDRREAKRFDRREERTGDEELEAYNAMLAGLSSGQIDTGNRAYYGDDYHDQDVQSSLHSAKHKSQHKAQNRGQSQAQSQAQRQAQEQGKKQAQGKAETKAEDKQSRGKSD